MKIAILGASGNMGERVFSLLLQEDYIEQIRVLAFEEKPTKTIVKANKKYKSKIEVIPGSIIDKEVVKKVLEGTSYVINMAAAIPPQSDKHPLMAVNANEIGPKVLAEVIEEMKEQPKLIHISTMGLYGDRNYKHPWAMVGDPLLISPFDTYTATKMRGEFTILESNIDNWVVIRQTAMLYKKLMSKNVSDGLMFHTSYNSPLEWATASDSAILMRNIIRKDRDGELSQKNFWRHIFNLAGGEKNRVTGYETLDVGFKIIGATIYDFFEPNYNTIRNFHGVWFSDGDELEKLFHYQNDNLFDFWDNILKTHKYFALAKLMPKKWLKAMIIKPLLKDDNAPYYWYNHKNEAFMLAYFNGSKEFEKISPKWEDFNLTALGKDENGNPLDYDKLRKTPTYLDHGFDIFKSRDEIDQKDLENVAKAHGGKLISKDFKKGDIFSKVEWENSDGERFIASPHTVLYGGHWWNVSYKENAWDFDRLAKSDKIYAQIWYDHHSKDENRYYYYDDKFVAHYKEN